MTENIFSPSDIDACRLSICIATRNRCALLIETISSALAQMEAGVEIVVVDGASSDGTSQAMTRMAFGDSRVRYFREEKNGGIDRDYDKAITYAKGKYCWLMSDDDLFLPGAINRVLRAAAASPSLIVVDAQVRDVNQSALLLERRLDLDSDRFFGTDELAPLFLATGRQLSFIGAAVIQRSVWLSRQREQYMGSYFIHIGVIFQQALPCGALVLVQPCLAVRYGNASWTARAFEIWAFRWPELVWSLPTISVQEKNCIVPERPYESIRELVLLRSRGAYSWTEYRHWIASGPSTAGRKLLCALIAAVPGVLINLSAIAYVLAFSHARRFALVDLMASPYYPFKFLCSLLRKIRSEGCAA